MKFRPRLSIPLQLTLLAILITTMAVFLTSALSDRNARALLTEQAAQDLQDKANLRLAEIRSSFLHTARELRGMSTGVGPIARDPKLVPISDSIEEVGATLVRAFNQPGTGKNLHGVWQHGVENVLQQGNRRDLQRGDQSVEDAVRSVELVQAGQRGNAVVLGRTLITNGLPGPLTPTYEPIKDHTIEKLVHRSRTSTHPIAEVSNFVLYKSGKETRCRVYLCRRIAASTPPLDTFSILVTLEIDRFMHEIASRYPAQTFFLLNGQGQFLYHPLTSRIGSEMTADDPFRQFPRARWGDPDQRPVAADLLLTGGVQTPLISVRNVQGARIPGVSFYYARKPLPVHSQEDLPQLNEALQGLLDVDPNLRCSAVHRLSRHLAMSHPDSNKLREAEAKVARLERELLGPSAPDWAPSIHCQHFVSHMTPMALELGGHPEPVRFVLSASIEEVQDGIRRSTQAVLSGTLVFVLIVASLLALSLSYYLTRPLRSLFVAADGLGKGDYGVKLPTRGPSEVVQLASSFRAMITQIQQRDTRLRETLTEVQALNQKLDTRVQERTAQLEESMVKLEVALDQARSAARAKDTFVANMSHELRQPLHIIIGFTEALREEAERFNQPDVIPDLDKILTAARHLLDIINDILDLAKVSAGKMDLSIADFDTAALVQNVQTLVAPLVAKNGNRFDVVLGDNLGLMRADEKRVRQVLLNLLSNASKFTREGVITLQVDRDGRDGTERMRFVVRDTGKGMTAEQVEKLFGRFYQADDSTRREQGGTGLGLAITRSLCDLMGGTIEVTSEPDKGSVFSVSLPVEPQARSDTLSLKPGSLPPLLAAVPKKTGADGQVHSHRVLVIDDDQSVRDLMERFLTRQGFEVQTAPNGEDGLRLARTWLPDIITLDVMMPGVDGWAILAALKTDGVTRDIPVVMVTIVDDRTRGYSLGATDYITKPIDWHRLGDLLHHHIDTPGSSGPILVVDDDADHREMVSRMLATRGREVVTAKNGKDALEKFKAKRPALVLLDLMMPIMDGFDFLSEVKRLDPERTVPIIVITAKELTEEDCQRLNQGVAHVLQKGNTQQLESIFQQIRARL